MIAFNWIHKNADIMSKWCEIKVDLTFDSPSTQKHQNKNKIEILFNDNVFT